MKIKVTKSNEISKTHGRKINPKTEENGASEN